MKNAMKFFAVSAIVFIILGIFGSLSAFADDAGTLLAKVDRYRVYSVQPGTGDFSMISWDGKLIINISGDTPVYMEDGTPARDRLFAVSPGTVQTMSDFLNNRTLIVLYSYLMGGNPPQTVPKKIVVTSEAISNLPAVVDPGATIDPQPIAPSPPAAPSIEKTARFKTKQIKNGLAMISWDSSLVIEITDETPIFFEDGSPVNVHRTKERSEIRYANLSALLENRNMVITFRQVAQSYPARVSPDKIVILYEKAVTLPQPVGPGPIAIDPGPIQISNEKTGRFIAWQIKNGLSMISRDDLFIINITDDTPIFYEDGARVTVHLTDERDDIRYGNLARLLNDRNLIVSLPAYAAQIYPASVTPVKIVVLNEQITPLSLSRSLDAGPPAVEKTDRFTLMDSTDALMFKSSDGELVIQVTNKTPIFFEDGAKYDVRPEAGGKTIAELLNTRLLTVTYTIVAQSFPPQTTPDKIVIHYEEAVTLPAEVNVQTLNGKIFINGAEISAPAPYMKGAVVMIPLRAVAEALGYEVEWEEAIQGVRVGKVINLWIGRDSYTVAKMSPFELGTAPELTDGRTYVPLSVIGKIITGHAACLVDGAVMIDTPENGQGKN